MILPLLHRNTSTKPETEKGLLTVSNYSSFLLQLEEHQYMLPFFFFFKPRSLLSMLET